MAAPGWGAAASAWACDVPGLAVFGPADDAANYDLGRSQVTQRDVLGAVDDENTLPVVRCREATRASRVEAGLAKGCAALMSGTRNPKLGTANPG